MLGLIRRYIGNRSEMVLHGSSKPETELDNGMHASAVVMTLEASLGKGSLEIPDRSDFIQAVSIESPLPFLAILPSISVYMLRFR